MNFYVNESRISYEESINNDYEEEHEELQECELDTNSKIDSFELVIKVFKFAALLMHIIFFLCIFLIKEFRTKNSMFLINLSIIGSIYIIYGMVTFDPEIICNVKSNFLCDFQGLFAHYCVYLSSFGVISLALYRLACVYMNNLNHMLNLSKLVLFLIIIWIIPMVIMFIPKFWLRVPIYYNDRLLTCRMNFTEHTGYFLFYILFANMLPSVSVGVFYFLIILKIRKSKRRIKTCLKPTGKFTNNLACTATSASLNQSLPNRSLNIFQVVYEINNEKDFEQKIKACQPIQTREENKCSNPSSSITSKTSTKKTLNRTRSNSKNLSSEFKLTVQFIILYFTYEVYAISNTIALIQASLVEKYMSNFSLALLRFLTWFYHFVNPIIYLSFHPVFLDKFKEKIIGRFMNSKKSSSKSTFDRTTINNKKNSNLNS